MCLPELIRLQSVPSEYFKQGDYRKVALVRGLKCWVRERG